MQTMTHSQWRAVTSPSFLLFLSLVSISGCSDELVTEVQVGGIPRTTLVISGEISPQHQTLQLSLASARVTDGIVTVNGFPIPHRGGGSYWADLPQAVPNGGTLNLKVVAGNVTFDASGVVIPAPTITAPTAGSIFAPNDSIRLAWSTPTDPDDFRLCYNCSENSNNREFDIVPGSAREVKIDTFYLVENGSVFAVYAIKNNFLKWTGSPAVLVQVGFATRSRDGLITVKR